MSEEKEREIENLKLMCAKNWKKIEKWFELSSQALNFFFIFTIAQDLKGN